MDDGDLYDTAKRNQHWQIQNWFFSPWSDIILHEQIWAISIVKYGKYPEREKKTFTNGRPCYFGAHFG